MSLVDALRRRLARPDAASFQLLGDDLLLLSGADLREAAAAAGAALARLAPALRPRCEAAQADLLVEAHGFVRRYNRNVHTRIAGYLELGRRLDFEYPWPVVAVLGIEQVMTGMERNRALGLAGGLLDRLGFPSLLQIVDGGDDLLRRTNRGIFADSVPTVLLGLRVHALRTAGDAALAEGLLDGPLPPLMDDECGALARALADGLAVPAGAPRFAALAALTLRHFAREQAIFSHHLGARRPHGEPPLVRRFAALRAVPAPVVERSRVGRTLRFRSFPLPATFDLRDHAARVDAFGRAFVTSVTGDRDDYRAATRHVLDRFGGEKPAASRTPLRGEPPSAPR